MTQNRIFEIVSGARLRALIHEARARGLSEAHVEKLALLADGCTPDYETKAAAQALFSGSRQPQSLLRQFRQRINARLEAVDLPLRIEAVNKTVRCMGDPSFGRPDLDHAELVRLWAADCVRSGRVSDVQAGHDLRYEPRARSQCARCDTALIGTKAGEIFRVGAQRTLKTVLAIDAPMDGKRHRGVYALAGCVCGALAFGDAQGNVYFKRRGADRFEFLRNLSDGAIRGLHLFEVKADEYWLLAASEDGWLAVMSTQRRAPLQSERLSRSARWVFAQGRFEGYQGDRRWWYLVSRDGQIIRATLIGVRGADLTGAVLRVESLGRLREFPTSVCVARDGARIVDLVYATTAGVRAASIDERGVRSDRSIASLPAISVVQIERIMGHPHLIVATRDGRIRSARWLGSEDSRALRWARWPQFAAEPLFVLLGTDQIDPPARQPWGMRGWVALRDHQLMSIEMHDMLIVRRVLRAELDRIPGLIDTDEGRYACITAPHDAPDFQRALALARRGGRLTLRALARRGFRDRQGLEMGVLGLTILLSAVRLGRAELLNIVGLLHDGLREELRDRPPETPDKKSAQLRVIEWSAAFLRKYFVGAYTYQKRVGLAQLAAYNEAGAAEDNFIYRTRLRAQGFDVEWFDRIAAPVTAVRVIGQSALVLDDRGGLLLLPAGARMSRRLLRTSALCPAELDLLDERGLSDERALVESTLEGVNWDDRRPNPVLAAIPWRSGFILGLDGHESRFAWMPAGQPAQAHLRPNPSWEPDGLGAGVLSLCRLPLRDGDLLATGGRDGYLRIGRFSPEEGFEPLPVGRWLGSAVRCLFTRRMPDGRSVLIAGTQSGEVFGFSVREANGVPILQVEFRDAQHAAIVALIDLELEAGRPELLVIDAQGDATRFSLRGATRDAAGKVTHRDFIGDRRASYRLGLQPLAAQRITPTAILIAGRRDDARGFLARVEFSVCDQPVPLPLQSEAARYVRIWAEGMRGARDQAEHDTVLAALLAAIPLDEPTMRAALASRRARRPADLGPLFDEAVSSHPGDPRELSALLKATQAQIEHCLDEAPAKLALAQSWFDQALRACLGLSGQTFSPGPASIGWQRALRIASLQALLLPGMRLSGNLPDRAARLEAYVNDCLASADPDLRNETLRALAVALMAVSWALRDGDDRLRAQVLPRRGDRPPVVQGRWMLDAAIRCLHAQPTGRMNVHPARLDRAECDITWWLAASVIAWLLRVLDDSVFVMLDHLSVNRVDPRLFEVIYQRLSYPSDAPLRASIRRYIIFRRDPSIDEVRDHLRPLSAAVAGSPDAAFLRARERCHAIFRLMDGPAPVHDTVALRARIQALTDGAEPLPPWAPALWPPRQRFMERTRDWIEATLVPLLGRSPAAIRAELADQDRRSQLTATLLEPEKGVARCLLRRWAMG